MSKKANRKARSIEELEAKIKADVLFWAETMTAEQVSSKVWSKYGYMAGVKGDTVYVTGAKGRFVETPAPIPSLDYTIID